MFNPWGLLESEREAGGLLAVSVVSLGEQARKFGRALALADYCDQQREPFQAAILAPMTPVSEVIQARQHALEINGQYVEWAGLAAEAGAIVLYNFAELIQTIDGLIGQCPTAKEQLDRKLMKEGRDIFYKSFPDYPDVRFAVAHAGKPFASPEINERQRIPDVGVMHINSRHGRTLYSTVNGKNAQYSLTADSHRALSASAELIERAFEPVRNFTLPYSSAKPRETPSPLA